MTNESNNTTTTPTMKVIVDRSRWLRGEGSMVSALQRITDGKRCCIGFACLTAGAIEDDIIGVANPRTSRKRKFLNLGSWNFDEFNSHGYEALFAAFAINDAHAGYIPSHDPENTVVLKYGDGPIVDDADREARLVRLFADQGLDLVFVDGTIAEGATP